MKHLLCVSLLCLIAQVVANEAEVTAQYKQGTYYVNASFEIAASAEAIINVLTDFDNLHQLHASVLESEVVSTASNQSTRVRIVVKDCALIFCKKITRVENVRQNGIKSLEAEVLPMLSDLRSGHTLWEFDQGIAVTNVRYQSSIQPKFWIPPIVRSHAVTKKLERRVNEFIKTLQAMNFEDNKK